MIAKLRGTLDSIGDGWAVVDVGGVGYLVFCSSGTLAGLPAPGQTLSLTIETVVREDHIHLFGFTSAAEREWFRLLQTVQGVGARLALAILGTLPVEELANCIAAQDKTGMTRAPGVGPKLAARILAELKDKVPSVVSPASAGVGAATELGNNVNTDAIAALVGLGYRPTEAHGAISGAAKTLGAEAPVEALIKAGLQELAQ
jgi:Holliday junction DNA helicase RuvA